jgi:hypothetical protein
MTSRAALALPLVLVGLAACSSRALSPSDASSSTERRPDLFQTGEASAPDTSRDHLVLDRQIPDLIPAGWVRRIGGPMLDSVHSLIADSSGNVYLAGTFASQVDFGGGVLVASSKSDLFIASYSPGGAHRWSKRIGPVGERPERALGIDANSNIYIVGQLEGPLDFGGGPIGPMARLFLASLSSSGAHRWSKGLVADNNSKLLSVAVSAGGDIYFTGAVGKSVDLDGQIVQSAGSLDVILGAYSSSGSHRWSTRFGGKNVDKGESIAVDSSGNVFLAGVFEDAIDFGGGAVQSNWGQDPFLVSFNSMGIHRWTKTFGKGDCATWPLASVATDRVGDLVYAAGFQGTIDLGGGPLVNPAPGVNLVVASFTGGGKHQWSKMYEQHIQNLALATGSSNELFVAGMYQDADLGGGKLTGGSEFDAYLASYSQTGSYRWSRHYGGPNTDEAVAIVAGNAVYAAGNFWKTVNFDGTTIASAGDSDAFLVRFLQ